MYDIRTETEAGALVIASLLAASQRGVAVRLIYDVAHPGPIPVPPPPETTPEAIEALPVPTRGIAGIPDLMHHKFVVRDGEAVWSGSANWTEDSWSRQENVIVTLESREIAYALLARIRPTLGTGCSRRHRERRPTPGGRRRRAGASLVLPRARRGAVASGREVPGEGTRSHSDRLAGADFGTDSRDARGGRERESL